MARPKNLTEAILRQQGMAVETLMISAFKLGYIAGKKWVPEQEILDKMLAGWRKNNPYLTAMFDTGEPAKPMQELLNQRINHD
jgi:hypothetical protein